MVRFAVYWRDFTFTYSPDGMANSKKSGKTWSELMFAIPSGLV